MKHLIFLIIGLSAALTARADIRLTFKAANPALREVVVVYQTNVVPVALDAQGTGSVTFDDITAVHARLFYGQTGKNFFMEDGDSLTFTFDGADFGRTLALEGPKARIFRYLNTVSYEAPDEADYAKSFADYRRIADAKEQAARKTLNTWHLERISPRFARIEAGRITYGFAQNLMMYAAGHPSVAKLQSWQPDADYLATVREYAVERPELRELMEYREYMKEAARILDNVPQGLSFYDRTLRQINWLADNVKNDSLREALVNALAVEYVDIKGTDSIAELRNLQGAYVTEPALIRAFDRAVAAHDITAPGRPSPDFKGTALDGKTVSLADLRGKYVYIDLWATWCGPCRMEFPHLRKLEAALSGRNIVFLGLSVDKDVAAWRKVAPTLGGTQAHIGPDSDFLKSYRVDGIPRFILLDPKGRIVNADMTRPSASGTLETLEKLPGI